MISHKHVDHLRAQAGQYLPTLGLASLCLVTVVLAISAGLTAVELVGLKQDLAAQRHLAAQHVSRSLAHGGAPLLAAPISQADSAVDQHLGKALKEAGMRGPTVRLADRRRFGPSLEVLMYRISAEADAASINALANWLDRRRKGVSLNRLEATTAPGGSARVEMDVSVLVRTDSR